MQYRVISSKELAIILEKHKKWQADPSTGARADLSSADLSYADLRSADLRSADLRFADLSYADLRSADLRFADLSYADLRYADLRSADLRHADLRFANFRSADLRHADLRFANFRSADLLIFSYNRHTAYFTMDGTLRIGCIVLPISEWLETFTDIGTEEGYTEREIKAYGQFIKLCAEEFAANNKEDK